MQLGGGGEQGRDGSLLHPGHLPLPGTQGDVHSGQMARLDNNE